MKILSFLQPTIHKLVMLVPILLLWILPTSREGVMKGTWEQFHGFPFTFMILVESTVGGVYRIWISRFYVSPLLEDIAILYLMVCLIYFAYRKIP